ncbi:MAG: TspO/MBR family protein [Candidatus Paceibacterota bacterium]
MKSDNRLANSFIVYVATVLFIAVGGLTTTQLHWLHAMQQPSWMPVDDIIATAWLILFLCVASSMSLFWNKSIHNKAFHYSIALYAGNAFLVLLWNFVFFGLHNLSASVWVAGFVSVVTIVLMVRVRKVITAAVLLVPYLAWLLFAMYVTQQIILLNP